MRGNVNVKKWVVFDGRVLLLFMYILLLSFMTLSVYPKKNNAGRIRKN
jgi:hypothetical protein